MSPRSGATLIEVLIAIFVMAIGMLALLAIFPVGALSMAEAIQRERSAECALNGDAAANMPIYRDTVYVAPTPPPGNSVDMRSDAFVTPYYTMHPTPLVDPTPGGPPPPVGLPDLTTLPTYTGSGYPVLVDPVGFNIIFGLTVPPASAAGPAWVGNMDGLTPGPGGAVPPPGVRRINFQFLSNANYDAMLTTPAYKTQKTLRWCALLDDMTFLSDASQAGSTYLGLPCPPSGSTLPGAFIVQRDDRYTWAYLLRLPSTSSAFNQVDLSVVVYSGRSFAAINQEHPFPAAFDPNNSIITLSWGAANAPPSLKRGGWVLDATNLDLTKTPPAPSPHGFFYRVVKLTERVDPTDPTTPNKLDLEIEGTLHGYTASTPAPQGWVVVMDNVVDVIERKTF
jgi:hypothetical protein